MKKTGRAARAAAGAPSASDGGARGYRDGATATDEAQRARFDWLEHGLGAKTWGARLRELDPRRFFLETWRVLEEQSAAAREARRRDAEREAREAVERGTRSASEPVRVPYDWRPLCAFAVGAVCLGAMEYLGHSRAPSNGVLDFATLVHDLDGRPPRSLASPTNAWGELRDSQWYELAGFAWWSAWRVLGYLLVPALVVKLVFRERLRDHGLETAHVRHHAWIYGLSYLVVFVGVMGVAAFDAQFTEYYPFYSQCSRSWFDFLSWELMYAAQFVSLEFFFRGFWLRSARAAMGPYAIVAMVVPYCMIHFGKPYLETNAAILAGLFLGTLAMRTRSIWGGCVVHIGVAVTMDVTSMIVSGDGLPTTWWPG